MPHFSCLDSRSLAQERYSAPWLIENWGDIGKDMFMVKAEQRWFEISYKRGSPPRTGNRPPNASAYLHPALLSDNLCRWAVDAAFVASTGESLSCCEQMIDLPRAYFGRLEEKPMERLWREDLLWGYRLPLSLGLLPRGCVGCARAPEHGVPMQDADPAGLIQLELAAPRSGHTSLPT
jgi:hypothetical protein